MSDDTNVSTETVETDAHTERELRRLGIPRATDDLRRVQFYHKGLFYDTENADVLFHWDQDDWSGPPDESYVLRGDVTETLYRIKPPKKNWYNMPAVEAYLLVRYNTHIDWDDDFKPVEVYSREQAIDWACERCQHRVQALFGKLPAPGQAPAYTRIW
jgi:hypothetical protein